MRFFLLSLFGIDAALQLYACFPPEKQRLRRVTKLLLMPLLMLCYLLYARRFQTTALLAMLCCLLGDLFLLFRTKTRLFGAGLAAFAMGHALYIFTFFDLMPAFPRAATLVPLCLVCALAAAVFARYLRGGELPDSFVAPGLIYGFLVCLTAGSAFVYARGGAHTGYLAALGGCLFVASDAALAVDRFRRPLPYRSVIVMGTYIIAQTMLFASLALA